MIINSTDIINVKPTECCTKKIIGYLYIESKFMIMDPDKSDLKIGYINIKINSNVSLYCVLYAKKISKTKYDLYPNQIHITDENSLESFTLFESDIISDNDKLFMHENVHKKISVFNNNINKSDYLYYEFEKYGLGIKHRFYINMDKILESVNCLISEKENELHYLKNISSSLKEN